MQPFPDLRRVLLKVSGEVLMGPQDSGFHHVTLMHLARQLANLVNQGVQVALLVGGGNFFRGASGTASCIQRNTGDAVGMMATVMNGLALRDFCEAAGIPTVVLSAFPLPFGIEPYTARQACAELEAGRLVIFVGGTGHPYFTTDTASVLRALEIKADALLKATKVSGVYSADPVQNSHAVFYPHLSYTRVFEEKLRVMDMTAVALAQENRLPMIVFSIVQENGLTDLFQGRASYSLITDHEMETKRT